MTNETTKKGQGNPAFFRSLIYRLNQLVSRVDTLLDLQLNKDWYAHVHQQKTNCSPGWEQCKYEVNVNFRPHQRICLPIF